MEMKIKKILSIGFLAGAMVLTMPFAWQRVYAEESASETTESAEGAVVPDGVSVQGMDVSGMTYDEVNEVVDDYLAQFDDVEFTLTAGDKNITVDSSDLGLTSSTDVATKALNYGKSGNLLERYMDQKDLESGDGKDFSVSLTTDTSTVKQLLSDSESELNTEASDSTLKHENGKFTYVAGTSGVTVKINKSATAIADYISNDWDGKDAEIALVTEETAPKGSEEELSVIQDVLGTYSTDYSSSSAARKTNVANGASKLNGIVLYPGETISVAENLNPMTAENGYALAASYENGTTVETYGGGICQVSTTLYNAVMRAELEIVTRASHSMIVTYVDPSMDAAIAGTSKDFQFKNNQDYPVYIESSTNGSTITFTIYGKETRDSNRTVTFESEVTSQTDPETEYVAATDQAIGYFATTQKAHTGYTAKLWKIVTVDGVEQSRDVYNNSTYKVSNKIVSVGVASDNAEATAAVNAAIATQDEATIKAAIAQWSGAAATTTTDPAATTTTDPAAEATPDATTTEPTTGEVTQ
jgi:vancomycin resistance protein YoaR